MKYALFSTAVALALFVAVSAAPAAGPGFLSDAPDESSRAAAPYAEAPSYGTALNLWKTPEDVSAWIGCLFDYDMDRAVHFGRAQTGESQAESVLSPEQLFEQPKGICVDLARFGVETLARIAPDLSPRYLRIEFEPATIGDATLRFHWLAVFVRGGAFHFFADSKRPGLISGPYASIADFIADYERYRQRKILSFQELDTFRRKTKAVRKIPQPSGSM